MPDTNEEKKLDNTTQSPENPLASTGIRTVIKEVGLGAQVNFVLSNDLPPRPEPDMTACFHPLPY